MCLLKGLPRSTALSAQGECLHLETCAMLGYRSDMVMEKAYWNLMRLQLRDVCVDGGGGVVAVHSCVHVLARRHVKCLEMPRIHIRVATQCKETGKVH